MASDLDRLLARALQQGPQNTITPQPQTVLDTAAIGTSPIPGLGDLVGLLADGSALAKEPSWGGALAMALGAAPFVPPAAARRVSDFDKRFEEAMALLDKDYARAVGAVEDIAQQAPKKWRIWDTRDKKWVSGDYKTKNLARKRVDRLDAQHGGVRYMVKEVD